jgi:hypothetical protein
MTGFGNGALGVAGGTAEAGQAFAVNFFGVVVAALAMAAATSASHRALSAWRSALPSVARTLSHEMPRNPAAETTTVAARLVLSGAYASAVHTAAPTAAAARRIDHDHFHR